LIDDKYGEKGRKKKKKNVAASIFWLRYIVTALPKLTSHKQSRAGKEKKDGSHPEYLRG
jgi:hypothetical protein